jgi:aldehyde:ferredoxin oxidoreductase
MGSKRIKAIVIDGASGKKPPITDPQAFRQAQKLFNQVLIAHPQTASYRDFGTAAMVMMCNNFGALPTLNFSSGEYQQAEEISGEMLRSTLWRGGDCESHVPVSGCTIRSRMFGDVNGKMVVSRSNLKPSA